MSPWILAARPRTLTAAFVPVLVGLILSVLQLGTLNRYLAGCTLFAALAIQIATNFINDALDFRRGTDNVERLGPTRAAASGLLTDKQLLRGASLVLGLALLSGIPLIQAGGWPILAIGLSGIFFAWAYTGGPIPLAYVGLGDLFVVLYFGVFAVAGTVWIQTHIVPVEALLAGLALGLLSVNLLAINNLRDREGDLAHHKKTLAVRFGISFARAEIIVCSLLPFMILPMLKNFAPLLAMPLALRVIRGVLTLKGRDLNQILAKSAALHLLYGLLLSAGFWLV